MCKIVTFTNSSKLDIKKTSEVVGNILLDIERDGFGYAVQGEQNVFGERCVADRFTSRLDAKNLVELPIVQKRQSSFGYLDKPKGPAIFHGRTSTNDKGLLNCHPMTRESWHLIHNGVVSDHGAKYQKLTTNDSEDLLQRLTLGISHVERDLSGYYAFCAIDPKGQLHVARDSIASLVMAWAPKVQSYILATTEDLLTEVAKSLKIKIGPVDKLQDDIYLIFQGNELIHTQKIKPRGYDSRQSSLASLSLGRDLGGPSKAYDSLVYDSDYNPVRFNDDGNFADVMRELEEMDDDYTIENEHGQFISVDEYWKLDQVSQSGCIIQRPDGSYLDEDYKQFKRG